jgi:hypothetical protein
MLKGTREGILKRIQPMSVHGQVSWDVLFVDAEEPESQVRVARIGPEAVDRTLHPGDRILLEYVLGTVISVKRAQPK